MESISVNYLATCPIKKQGGLSAIINPFRWVKENVGSRENLHEIYIEYNNCKGPGLHLFNGTTRFSMSTSLITPSYHSSLGES